MLHPEPMSYKCARDIWRLLSLIHAAVMQQRIAAVLMDYIAGTFT